MKNTIKRSQIGLDISNYQLPVNTLYAGGSLGLVRYFIRLASQKGESDEGKGTSSDTNINRDDFLLKGNEDGETALYHAVRHEHKEVVEELMRTNIKLASIQDNQNVSPLYLATVLNSLPIVTSLVRFLSGKNVENVPREAYAGPDGRTALHAAALKDKDFVQQILSLNAQKIKYTADKVGGTPLHYAASVNNVGAIKLLLEADENKISLTSAYVTNKYGLFPVHIAAKLGHVKVLIELFKHCPDCDELLDRHGRNFIHLAVEEKKAAVVRWACQNAKFEKAINTQDKEGDTPLHLAVKAKDKYTFGPLILSGRAQFSCMNKDGLTPLDIADAQRKDVFSHRKNPEYIIYETLGLIGCPRGIELMNRVKQENKHQNEDEKENKEEKEKKEEERYENMAKSMSLGSVLIASAAFAAAFSVSGLYINKRDLYNTAHLSMAFKVFVVMDVYAFLCAIIATCLLIEAALNFLDPSYRKKYLIECTALVMMAARGFIVAFTIGVYVILTPVSKWLAIMVALAGTFGPALIQPHQWPSLLIMRTWYKCMCCKGFLRKKHYVSGEIPAKVQKTRDTLFLVVPFSFCLSIFSYCFALISVLMDGYSNSERKQRSSFYSINSEDVTLSVIILCLMPSSILPLYSIIVEKYLKPSKKMQCMI